jgi:hypothetical protein
MARISARRSAVAGVATLMLAGGASGALASTATPTLGSNLGVPTQGFGKVKPPTVSLGGDPTGLAIKLSWKSWGAATAVGSGMGYYPPPGKPTADSVKVPVTLDASELGTCKGKPAYKRLAFSFHYKGKSIKGSVLGICGKLTYKNA